MVARYLKADERVHPVLTSAHTGTSVTAPPLQILIRDKLGHFEEAGVGFEVKPHAPSRARVGRAFLAPPAGQVNILTEREKRQLGLYLVDKNLIYLCQAVVIRLRIVRHLAPPDLILHTKTSSRRFRRIASVLTIAGED